MTTNNPPASSAPMIGPTTGIHAYPKLESPFPGIGRTACACLGPKSLAGEIAYPVNPPSDIPMETIIANTKKKSVKHLIPDQNFTDFIISYYFYIISFCKRIR